MLPAGEWKPLPARVLRVLVQSLCSADSTRGNTAMPASKQRFHPRLSVLFWQHLAHGAPEQHTYTRCPPPGTRKRDHIVSMFQQTPFPPSLLLTHHFGCCCCCTAPSLSSRLAAHTDTSTLPCSPSTPSGSHSRRSPGSLNPLLLFHSAVSPSPARGQQVSKLVLPIPPPPALSLS